MSNFFRKIIRASSFFQKEIFEIIRQPRLVATLVLGPFMILFIFGIGYRTQSPTMRALFVAQTNNAIPVEEIQKYSESMGELLVYSGVTADLKDALARLQQNQVDLVIVEPGDAASIIKNNQQGIFTIYYQEIDPDQVSYINYLGWLYVGAVNQQVLLSFALQAQKEAATVHASLQEAHQNVLAMRQAVQTGDEVLAGQKQKDLAGNVDAVSMAAGVSLGLLDSLQQTKDGNGGSAAPAQNSVADLRQNTTQLGAGAGTKDERLARLDKIDKDLSDLDGKLTTFQNLDPAVVISPFRSLTKSVANIQPSTSEFFAPAVLALLLQHLAVMFAALSVVRERNVGTMELFRVSPLSAGEALFGKYISYMLFGGVIAAVLSALLVTALHMPMLGNWLYFALVVTGVLYTSLGIGFVISIVSQTDSQAVQYSMIILLASVFFSGLLLRLSMLWIPVRVISWLLPTTYGTVLLRDIALRGIDPNWMLLGGLFAIGFVLMMVSWWLMSRLITSPK